MRKSWLYFCCAVTGLCLAACCVCAALYPKKEPSVAVQAVAEEPPRSALEQFALEREQLRAMQLSQLDEILHDEGASRDLQDDAERERLAIVRNSEIEQSVGGILRARGFADAAAAASGAGVTVMVRAEALTEQEVSVITEEILSQCGVSASNLKIIPIK